MTDLERAQLKMQCYLSIECNDRNQRLTRAKELWAWLSEPRQLDHPGTQFQSQEWTPDPPPMYDEHAAGPSPGGPGMPGV